MRYSRLATLVTVLSLSMSVAAGANADSSSMKNWQMTRLLEPTPADRKSEEKGRVMIYDGLTDKDVERAFDEQFDRVEHMMFTHTLVTDDSGEPERSDGGEFITEGDDGCD
jgi:hypothetical protein